MCKTVGCLALALYVYTVVQLLNIHTPSSHSLFRDRFTKSSGVYKRLGQFDYGQPNITTDRIHTYIEKENDWIYIGEVKKGTNDTPHGIGIKVKKEGDIQEGHWKDGQLNGRGRGIGNIGDCYIGEYKDGILDGEGTLYYNNGKKEYEGGLKCGSFYGQGTFYAENGDKCTGQWDDGNSGYGEVEYKYGGRYTGHWIREFSHYVDFKRHGFGTLYSKEGQVLNQGRWESNRFVGKE